MPRSFRSILALLLCSLIVAGRPLPREKTIGAADDLTQTSYSLDDESIKKLQVFFQMTLAAAEKRFAGEQGQISGFSAGTTYPQIWLRDSATTIPAARYYYDSDYLTSWLEEHLSHQRSDGSLYDWIASGPTASFLSGAPNAKEIYRRVNSDLVISADKNTTEADQETSAVDAAYQIFQINRDENWLAKNVQGETILHRLDHSLQYLLRERFDSRHGLITNAFTADWGDVSPTYVDQRSIYLDAATPLVSGLYTNVLFYRAATQLSELYGRNNPSRAAYWKEKAAATRRNINKHLWQKEKGFYRIHISITSRFARDVDESDYFAMGGNGLAVLCGVANATQAARIFSIAEQRQRRFGVSTIAGVLLPPYPTGFFRHPAVSQEYKYQNGGQWDWFAGRFLLAEFEVGHAAQAYRQLQAIAAKAVVNNGLYEWHTRDGKGEGSPNYVGSAGALAGAVFQGLFGVYLSGDELNLKVRLGASAADLNLFEPATKTYVAYRFKYLRPSALLTLSYESNSRGRGTVCMLLPVHARARNLQIDGRPAPLRMATKGLDSYACFATDWQPHNAQLRLAGPR